jgi:hypothetical protein
MVLQLVMFWHTYVEELNFESKLIGLFCGSCFLERLYKWFFLLKEFISIVTIIIRSKNPHLFLFYFVWMKKKVTFPKAWG